MKPFTDIELKMKEICLAHPVSFKRSYITKDEFDLLSQRIDLDLSDILTIPLDESLDENTFFKKDENVAIVEHARYLPPLLHSHAFFELVYAREGSCTHYVDNKAHTLLTGDICMIAPGHEHALAAFSDEADIINLQIRTSTFEKSFLGILSDKDVLSDFFMHCLYNIKGQSCITFRCGDDPKLKALSLTITDEYYSDRKYKNRMMDTLISTFFIQLLRDHEKDVILDPGSKSENDDNLILMLQYIQSNFATLTLSELARFFGYSTRHITRLIKDSTGKSFTDITKELRMKKAAELLIGSELPISSIMEMLGYTDLSSFYKAFKSYYCVAPAKYREQHMIKA